MHVTITRCMARRLSSLVILVSSDSEGKEASLVTRIVIRTVLSIALASVTLFVVSSVASADPVAECQKVTDTEVETGQCLQDTLDAANAVLQTAFENAQAAADELDQVTGRPVARQAIERSQQQWFQFQQVNCLVPAAMAAGASGSGNFTLGCQIDMARARTDELRVMTHR